MTRWLLLIGLCLASPLLAQTVAPTPSPTPHDERPLRVMLIGNSLIYTNNLPGLLRSLARAQDSGPRIDTRSYVLPGADLQQHLRQATALSALQSQPWDVLVLQERGGLLACLIRWASAKTLPVATACARTSALSKPRRPSTRG